MKMANRYLTHVNADLSAGVVVFLVALPLCLGIALASGAPLFAGIISGAVGGLLVAWLSGSEVSVSGPAAGLTVIVAAGIATLGSYETFLFAVALSGMLQILLGLVRAGSLASLMPNSVITGMLAAIGIIIVLKQIPHGLGRDSDFEGDENFWQFMDQENSFTEIVKAVYTFSPSVLTITVVSLTGLLVWNHLAKKEGLVRKVAMFIPGPLIAVVLGIVVNEAFGLFAPSWYITQESGHLVQLPVAESVSDFFSQFHTPNFDLSKIGNVGGIALTLAVIGSIETLLCLEAGDKIDPYRRVSSGNRELVAQGIGNIVCGMIGGLPMTSVVVRTSANIYAGARTRLSVFIHGAFLLLTAAFIPSLLNKIPLGALAAVLFVVGYKLANFSLFIRMYKLGVDQFLPFIVTVVAIVLSDILTGVISGIIVSIFFVVKSNYHSAITIINDGDHYLLRFTKDVSFVNKMSLKKALRSIPDNSTVVIDGRGAIFIDKDIYEIIEDFKKSAQFRNINVATQYLESKSLKLFGSPT